MCITKTAFNMIFKKGNGAGFAPDAKMTDKIMGPNFRKLYDETQKNEPLYIARQKEIIPIKTFDGYTLNGDFFLSDTPSKDTVVFVHGYNSCGSHDFANQLPFFLNNGFNVLCTNNRGSRVSECPDITFGVFERLDTKLWVDEINKKFPDGNIFLVGTSLGGATVCCMSEFEMQNVRAILSDCAYTSARFEFSSLSKRLAHFTPRILLHCVFKRFNKTFGISIDEFSPINAVKRAKYPMLFIHGKEDRFITVDCVHELYNACPTEKKLFLVDNAGHAASYVHDKDGYEKQVLEFFDKYKK